jgi:hypothetical protein
MLKLPTQHPLSRDYCRSASVRRQRLDNQVFFNDFGAYPKSNALCDFLLATYASTLYHTSFVALLPQTSTDRTMSRYLIGKFPPRILHTLLTI